MTITPSTRWPARILRRITLILLPPALLLIFVTVMLLQFVELQDRNEVVSTGIVIALLSMSALSFGWNRSLSDLSDRENLGPRIHYAGEGLFIAALLALVALFFIWIKLPAWISTPWVDYFLFALHWFFLLLAMIYAIRSVWDIFIVAMLGQDEDRKLG